MLWIIVLLDGHLNINPETFSIGLTAINLIKTLDFHDQKIMEDVYEDDIIEVFI